VCGPDPFVEPTNRIRITNANIKTCLVRPDTEYLLKYSFNKRGPLMQRASLSNF